MILLVMIWWIIWVKKEMARIQVDSKMIPVTLIKVDPQYIIWYKTLEKDWYEAVIVWVDKKEDVNKNNKKLVYYSTIKEFNVDSEWIHRYSKGSILNVDESMFKNNVSIVWVSKWKWFSGIMKRFNAKWWPKTHGSKFHRQVWSMGNRKPRRVMKWHPHAWRMWNNRITIKDVRIYAVLKDNKETVLVANWSIPWWYNSKVYINII